MSWLFSRALAVEYLGASYLVGEQSVRLKSNRMPQVFCAPDRMTAYSRLSRFGMTYAPLTADRGAELLTSFLAAFPVRTLVQPAKVRVSMESAADYGESSPELLAKFDHDTSSWKTAQFSLQGDLEEYLETWPNWGMMRSGVSYRQPIPERLTSESGSGSWPTPTTMDSLPPKSPEALNREATVARPGRSRPANLRDCVHPEQMALWSIPDSAEQDTLNLWPTPRGGNPGSRPNRKGGKILEEEIMISVGLRKRGVRLLPTPRTGGQGDKARKENKTGKRHKGDDLETVIGGKLNPTWVEWLMGWPIGWTDLKPLGMAKFQQWLDSHMNYTTGKESHE